VFGFPPEPPTSGPQPLVSSQGFVYDRVPGLGYQPRTQFGFAVRDTTPGGFPLLAPSVGPRQPERMLGGLVITGPDGELLFKRAPGQSPR
jgi:hypothetical protein